MTISTKWQRNDDWVGTEIEDSFVMLNIDLGKYVALNETASIVWHALDLPRTETELEAVLTGHFAVEPAQCRQSLADLLGKMQSLNMASPV